TLVGGNITLFTELCEKTRQEAFQLMLQHAEAIGANAVIGIRYDANEGMEGVTEGLCYGTAVGVAPAAASNRSRAVRKGVLCFSAPWILHRRIAISIAR